MRVAGGNAAGAGRDGNVDRERQVESFAAVVQHPRGLALDEVRTPSSGPLAFIAA